MIIQLTSQKLTAAINSTGAELLYLSSPTTHYIWEVNDTFWNKTSPVLFPIVGRLKNDTYQVNEKQYHMSRHGFARNYDFEIVEKKENQVIFSLKENQETLKAFPFSFTLEICYTLQDNILEIKYSVKNDAEVTLPFSIGAHPAFAIDCNKNDYHILFDSDSDLLNHELENEQFSGKTNSILLTNQRLPLSYSLFEKDALVFKNITSRSLTIFENENPYLKIHLGNFPHLGIWTKPKAPFLCIEPWYGYADSTTSTGDIFNKEAIQTLAPNENFDCHFTIEIL